MSTPLKTFTGFKGVCAFAQIGDVGFAIMAKNERQLAALWSELLANAGPLDPAGIKRAILIEASLLPTPTGSHPPAQGGAAPGATLGQVPNNPENPEGVPPIDV